MLQFIFLKTRISFLSTNSQSETLVLCMKFFLKNPVYFALHHNPDSLKFMKKCLTFKFCRDANSNLSETAGLTFSSTISIEHLKLVEAVSLTASKTSNFASAAWSSEKSKKCFVFISPSLKISFLLLPFRVFSSRSQWKTIQVYWRIRLNYQWLQSLYQNGNSPKFPKQLFKICFMTLFSFIVFRHDKFDFYHLSLDEKFCNCNGFL